MAWADKALATNKVEREVKKIMNGPEYKKIQKERDIELTKNALVNFSLIACGFLEVKHGYKGKGLEKFLEYLKKCIVEIGKDEGYLDAQKEYFQKEYGLCMEEKLKLKN